MDEKDLKIIELLKENCKLSTYKISKKTAIPITTVHHRIKKLEKEGVIQGYSVVLDKKKMGKLITAYVLASVDMKTLRDNKNTLSKLVQEVQKKHEVEEMCLTTGQHDVVLKIRVSDVDALNHFLMEKIRKVEGIGATQTMVVINEVCKK